MRLRRGQDKIESWEKLKKHMRLAFLPHNNTRLIYQQLQILRQGSKSINEYTKEFHQLIARKDISEEQLVARYIGDKVWCDVVLMDACHLLLGRPWKYDRFMNHDGRSDNYSFMWNNKKLTLVPYRELMPKPQNVDGKNLLTYHKMFIEELDDLEVFYILLDKESPSYDFFPPQVKPIIEEFQGVFPADLPNALPPLREVQYQIYLVPGSSLPNKAHYRTSPKEHEELRRQVEELIAKGFIRPSLSSCEVPDLLVPKKDGSCRMCVDSTTINKITLKYRFPIPSLDDLLDQLSGACVFSKLDFNWVSSNSYQGGR
ncbi:uncharacterized protein LOC113344089 [Papaver somniferum]|uniref:uncharacterized protein LOC113344089 n=1 Tax=Papaver somniferum TaxID=3469 RepID=UPI000E7004FF|nr:uncharacterized protein LOC113344089 [Papaver somniferum]